MTLDENAIIRLLMKQAGRLPAGYLPIGDDVAVLPSKQPNLVLKSDMLVAKTDVPPGMTWRQAGRKSVAMCVSDFAAKGVVPEVFMVSLGIPRSLSDGDVRSLVKGFGDGMDEWAVRLVGGDTNEADDLIVDCLMAGFAERVVPRNGARVGDLVVVTGEFGTTSAGLKILLQGARSKPAFRRLALRSVYSPAPRLKLGLALAGFFSAAMDSSDGLAICLHTLCEMSGVGMRISRLPYPGALAKFAERNGYTVEDLVLYGGEEYEIVGTIDAGRLGTARRVASSLGAGLAVIGRVVAGKGVASSRGRVIQNKGWVHLA